MVAAIEASGGRASSYPPISSRQTTCAHSPSGLPHTVDILLDSNSRRVSGRGNPRALAASFDRGLRSQRKAPFLLTAAIAPNMVARGGGAIINVTTMAAQFGMVGLSAYGASKAALALLTKAWAAEYGPKGVRVNAVSPGPTRTPGHRAMGEGFAAIIATIPFGACRRSAEWEIADTVAFLASNRASYLNRAVIPATDGGRVAV